MRLDDFAAAHPYPPPDAGLQGPIAQDAPTISYTPVYLAARNQEKPKRQREGRRAQRRAPLMPGQIMPGQLYGGTYQERSSYPEQLSQDTSYQAPAPYPQPNAETGGLHGAKAWGSFSMPSQNHGYPGEAPVAQYQQIYWTHLHEITAAQLPSAPVLEDHSYIPEYLKAYRNGVWTENPSLYGIPVEWPEWQPYDEPTISENMGYPVQTWDSGRGQWVQVGAQCRANDEAYDERYGEQLNWEFDGGYGEPNRGSSDGRYREQHGGVADRRYRDQYNETPDGRYGKQYGGMSNERYGDQYNGAADERYPKQYGEVPNGSHGVQYGRLPDEMYQELTGGVPDWTYGRAPEGFGSPNARYGMVPEGGYADIKKLPPQATFSPYPPVYREASQPYTPPPPELPEQDEPEKTSKLARMGKFIAIGVIVLMLIFCLIQIGHIVLILMRNEKEIKDNREAYPPNMRTTQQSGSRVDLLPQGVTFAPTQTAPPLLGSSPATGGPAAGGTAITQTTDTADLGDYDADPESLGSQSQRTNSDHYDSNPDETVLDPFVTLRIQNADVIGHLKIDNLVDETVVQKDNNLHYVTRNALGSSDIAGAVYVDELCKLLPPPENLILRGKSAVEGRLFAPLLRYLDGGALFMRQNALIRMNTIYEEAGYVIFAVIVASTEKESPGYFDYAGHPTFPNDREMERYVNRARQNSLYEIPVDVRPSDRLLTICTLGNGSEKEYLVIMARMLRTGETAQTLSNALSEIREK